MGKKRDKANENIRILIDELIVARKYELGTGNCPYFNKKDKPCDKYERECDWCRDEYFEDMREELENKYIVK